MVKIRPYFSFKQKQSDPRSTRTRKNEKFCYFWCWQLWQSAVAEGVDKEKLKRWIVFHISSLPEDNTTCTKSLRTDSGNPDRGQQAVLCFRKIDPFTFPRQCPEAKSALFSITLIFQTGQRVSWFCSNSGSQVPLASRQCTHTKVRM